MVSAILHDRPAPVVPDSDDARIAWLRLARSRRVGPTTFRRLLRQFGTVPAALAALPEIAAEAGERDYQPAGEDRAIAEWNAGQRIGARLLCLGDPDYPHPLLELNDAPPVLWMLGRQDVLQARQIAVVGARNASVLGTRMAARLAQELGEEGFGVVSGLARGIDAAAHGAALKTGTVAVQAGGLDVLYPRENAPLARDIARDGVRLSEMPMGLQPQARHFPRRNRIISGVAEAVVVVEGAARSGSLITARDALDQGREVMAVPGHPFDARAAGCNMLIRDGATLVRGAKDVVAALSRSPDPGPPQPAEQPTLPGFTKTTGGALADQVLAVLTPSPLPEDALIRETGATPKDVLAALAELTLSGAVERGPGGMISKRVADP